VHLTSGGQPCAVKRWRPELLSGLDGVVARDSPTLGSRSHSVASQCDSGPSTSIGGRKLSRTESPDAQVGRSRQTISFPHFIVAPSADGTEVMTRQGGKMITFGDPQMTASLAASG